MSLTIIVGMRRSGTTVFWKWFRHDRRLTCFDEPFSEQLMTLPREHPKEVFAEYRSLLDRSPQAFWAAYAPVHRAEELDAGLTSAQRSYLSFLADQGDHVVLDVTRCHLKVAALAEIFPEARFVHLVRDHHAFASSHLVPSRSDLIGRARAAHLRRTFWSRPGGFDSWGMETLCGTGPGSKLSLLLGDSGYDVHGFYTLPAVGRLLVLHHFMTAAAESALAATGRSTVVQFEHFTESPEKVVRDACTSLGVMPPSPPTERHLFPASPGHRPSDHRWVEVDRAVTAICPGTVRP